MLVSVYGAGLSNATLTVAFQPVQILYASDVQINAVLPVSISGLVQLTASSPSGSQSVNLLIEAAVPALFPGLVFHEDGSLVSPASPAQPGETVSLVATGLGAAPVAAPQVTVGGQAAAVSNIATPAPGINQVYFAIPVNSGTGNAIPILLTSRGYSSNAVAVPIAADPLN
jgi:uncharacterized protein (TIGR03437 family)